MDLDYLRKLLDRVKRGEVEVDRALDELKNLPFEEIGFATIDHHRPLRQGFPEVIWGKGKSPQQILTIINKMKENQDNVLATRVTPEKAEVIKQTISEASYHPTSQVLTLINHEIELRGKGTILIISAGTSDIPVAEEALITAKMMGNETDCLYDVGVAGLHRLVSQKDKLFSARVLIVVAGMEGALPSVVGGLVAKPIIAVPTSAGYGASFGGITALLGMLNSCAAGVSVVNIDNGFGAGYAASLINRV
jgi:hypothetical protein